MKRQLLICLLLASATVVTGQTEKLLVPSDLKQQTVVTEPVTLRKGYLRTGLLLNYRVADKYFDDSGKKDYYRTSSWGSKASYGITLQYGVSDRFQIDILTEYMNNLQEISSTEISALTNTTVTTTSKQTGLGIGDSRISFKYQIIPETERKFSMTGQVKTTIPTGNKNPGNIKSENEYDLPVGDGTYALGVNFTLRKVAYPYSFSWYYAYNYNFRGKKIINTADLTERKFRFGNLFESGLNWNLHLNEWIVFGNEINFYHEGQGKVENSRFALVPSALMPSSWALSYEPGLIFQVFRFRLGESVRIPVKGKNVAADPLYMLFGQYIF